MSIGECKRAPALFLAVMTAACNAAAGPKQAPDGWQFMTMSGDVVSVVMAEGGLLVERGDVSVRNAGCAAKGIALCIRSHVFNIAVPTVRPTLGQQWTLDYLTFTEMREIPSLSLLGRTYDRVRVIRSEKRWGDGVVTSMDLYYSDEAGLLGFWAHGGELYLASQVPSLIGGIRDS